MYTASTKPVIFISYAHADAKWCKFVLAYLKPAVKDGIFGVWVDHQMMGGADWNPEIDRQLRACDIFILLVSAFSTASDYIVDKEIATIRERQARGEDVYFYPLLVTPTPDAGLDKVKDKNLRPRDGRPFSAFANNARLQEMTEVANEIAKIAEAIADGKGRQQPKKPFDLPTAELAREATYALDSVRIAFEAFGFRSDQFEQWKVLTNLLQKERGGKIADVEVPTEVLEDFANDEQRLLTYVGQSKRRGKSVRIYQFNDRFYSGVDKYSDLFFASEIASGLKPHELTLAMKLSLIKVIHDLQVKKYYPAWKELVNCLEKTAASNEGDHTLMPKDLGSKVFWGVLIVFFWEAYVSDPSKSMIIQDLPEPLSRIVHAFNPTDMSDALRFLSEEDGCKILLRVQDEHPPTDWRYRFNAIYADCLRGYCVSLRRLRSELASALAPYSR
jgi:hypothetical protein